MNRRLASIVLCTVVLAVSGCGSENKIAVKTTNSVETTQTRGVTGETEVTNSSTIQSSTAQSFSPALTWKWRESSPDGYKYFTKFQVGHFTHISAAPLLPGFSSMDEVASTCGDFDRTTDAVMPAAITMTNETRNFPTTLSTNVVGGDAGGYGMYTGDQQTALDLVASYSNGLQCHNMASDGTDGWDISWNDPISPGQSSGVGYAYFIIRGFYNPNHPSGDPSLLSNALVGHKAGVLVGNRRWVTWIDGPGVITDEESDGYGLIPLSGKNPCRYRSLGKQYMPGTKAFICGNGPV